MQAMYRNPKLVVLIAMTAPALALFPSVAHASHCTPFSEEWTEDFATGLVSLDFTYGGGDTRFQQVATGGGFID